MKNSEDLLKSKIVSIGSKLRCLLRQIIANLILGLLKNSNAYEVELL